MRKLLLLTLASSLFLQCQNSSTETPDTKPKTNDEQLENTTEAHKEDSGPILGIDVSHFQGDINWDEIKKANITFAYSKATQGEAYTDPRFHNNWANIDKSGLHRGAYHFYVAADDAKKQAEHFVSTVQSEDIGDMPPMLDLEQGGMPKPVADKKAFQKSVLQWLTIVESKLGVKPIIYTNTPFGNEYLNSPEFADYHLWIAEYGVKEPKIPQAWKEKGWLIWQRSERGTVEGAVGNVDHDLYNPKKVDFHTILDRH